MDVREAVRTRRSVRSYADKPVEADKLDRVLEAARLAPSASNRQERRFIVVRDAQTRKKLAKAACDQGFIGTAPVVIAACATESSRVMACGQPAYTVDVTIAVDHMTLQAAEEGLGTCWIGAFHEDEVKQVLEIPDTARVVSLLPLGYPLQVPGPTPRKPKEALVAFDRW
jgi:nitroreductase